MTRPGDPGHAAAAREEAAERPRRRHARDGDGCRAPPPPRGPCTAACSSSWPRCSCRERRHRDRQRGRSSTARRVARLDASLRRRDLACRRGHRGAAGIPRRPAAAPSALVLSVPGQPAGTLGGLVIGARHRDAGYIADGRIECSTCPGARAMRSPPCRPTGEPHTIDVRPLGDVPGARHAEAQRGRDDRARPAAAEGVNAQTTQLALTVALVAIARPHRRPRARLRRRAPGAQPAGRGHRDGAARLRAAARPRRRRARPSACPSTTTAPRSDDSAPRSTACSATWHPPCRRASRASRRCAASSPTRATSCARPLASIRGYAELTRLHGGELPPDVMHAIGRIESESVRMTELVEDLLLLARLDEGRELAVRPVDLGRVVVEAVGDAQAAGPDHDWEVRLPDAATVVTGDEPRLRQVVTNLLANARVHTPEGTSVVACSSATATTSCSRSRTTAPASRPTSSARSSSGSRAATRRARAAPEAPGSDSRSCGPSSRRTTATCR